MTEEEKESLVARILQDDIPDEEKPNVKQLLAEDKALQAELRLQLQIRRLAQAQQEEEAESLRNVFRGYVGKEAKTLPLRSGWRRIAAVALLLLA